MDGNLQSRITENQFVNRIRIEAVFDEDEYRYLRAALKLLAIELKNESSIDKRLAQYLYSIPQITRNMFLSFDGVDPKPEIVEKLEDAWVELDSLVLDCLSE